MKDLSALARSTDVARARIMNKAQNSHEDDEGA
jgi:hypothetical protein